MLHEKYKTLFERYGLTTRLRLAHFYAQVEHESGFILVRESLYYKTTESLRATFKSPFKGKSDAFVSQYLRNSQKLANYVYANRGGNGNESSGEGYKYRAGGFLGLTFKENYFRCANDTGIDCLKNPNVLLNEADALISALWYWKMKGLNEWADKDDLDGVSDHINIGRKTIKIGDSNGYADRLKKYNKWKQLLK